MSPLPSPTPIRRREMVCRPCTFRASDTSDMDAGADRRRVGRVADSRAVDRSAERCHFEVSSRVYEARVREGAERGITVVAWV